ncbi:MAG: DUF1501 domain-containing protein [Gammaproteobacteria bacterium]|nr:DUF1501 domain-containing protein [Gammaproteobacteria bacterium]MDH3576449.1 DUF1501 domain-containing protein [Gammaproteobacteria bacterium]
MKKINRREFLKTSSAVAAAAAFASTPGLAYTQVIGTTAPFNDYRALVCVFLHGGNDSFNMLVPNTDAEYNIYAASRQNLSIAKADLLPINPVSLTPGSEAFGLHPMMGRLQALFEAGNAAFVANVGPLVEPTTKIEYQNQSVILPSQLFSHNDQQAQWNSLKGANTSKTGWAGRMADLIRSNVANQKMATNASLYGTSLFQSADETIAYVMGQTGPLQFEGFSTDPDNILFDQRLAFQRVVEAQYDSIYERGFADIQARAIDAADSVSMAIRDAEASGAISTVFPNTPLGRQLETVAKLIYSRNQLDMQRQIFFVGIGGFDSHDNQNLDQPDLLGGISESIAAFYDATFEIGVPDSVTTFTQSDFGRTLTSNGDGTDHAWGGNQVVVGGAVKGRDIYGNYPVLEIGGPEDVGGGRMIPATSADQYAATLAKWFGIPDIDLDVVAPNLGNFAERDLGFMIT